MIYTSFALVFFPHHHLLAGKSFHLIFILLQGSFHSTDIFLKISLDEWYNYTYTYLFSCTFFFVVLTGALCQISSLIMDLFSCLFCFHTVFALTLPLANVVFFSLFPALRGNISITTSPCPPFADGW